MWKDLGRKESMPSCGPCGPAEPAKDDKPRIHYPYLNLDTAEPINAKADQEIEVKVKLRFKGFNKSDYNKERPYSNQFDVMAIDFGSADIEVEEDVEEGQEGLQNALEAGLKKKVKAREKEETED